MFQNKETWLNNPAAGITNVAGMIIEPFQSSAGYIIPPPEYLKGLKNLCDKYGILFVSDEVQTGMGRTGKMWAVEHADVVPDLITVAKSISNGLPISLCMGRQEVLDSWGPGGHCTTFCGYPVACAGGLRVAQIMKRDNIPGQAHEKGLYLEECLRGLMDKHPLIGDFNIKGLYAGVELVRDRKTKEPATKETAFVSASCLKEGLIFISSGYHYNRIAFAPPLIISREEISRGVEILDRVLTQTEEKFEIKRPATVRSAIPEEALKA
jgi:4-aminobutyrate aminotransferase-like enzyme